MAKVGAQRGAELTGRSKSTIQRAMNSGKLSFELDANGRRRIDVSELDRVFGLKKLASEKNSEETVAAELQKASDMIEMERMKMRIKMLEDKLFGAEQQIEDLKDQRDQWQKQAQNVMITSQHSQKQTDELKAELEERKKVEAERRKIMLERRMKKLQGQNQNTVSSDAEASQSMWGRIMGKMSADKAA